MSVCDSDIEKVPAASHAKLNGSLAYDAQMYKVELNAYHPIREGWPGKLYPVVSG